MDCIFKLIYPQKISSKFNCHLTVFKWQPKMLVDPFVAAKIQCHRPMANEFSQCCQMAIKFRHHITMATENLLVTIACGD
jgi:hypothetical protein